MKTNEKGLTLVEMIVVSALFAILGGAAYSALHMYSSSSGDSISGFLMQQQYDNVARQIAKDVRRASYVLGPSETPASHSEGFDTVCSITLWNNAGQVFAQYAISGNLLLEGSSQVSYQAGGRMVRLVATNSFFIIDPQRKRVSVHLALCTLDSKITHILSTRKDVFLCRN
jgi:prepilin-type N-terminal cleavage/methylation domain-containing protein